MPMTRLAVPVVNSCRLLMAVQTFRSVERGSRIVAVVPTGIKLILQVLSFKSFLLRH